MNEEDTGINSLGLLLLASANKQSIRIKSDTDTTTLHFFKGKHILLYLILEAN